MCVNIYDVCMFNTYNLYTCMYLCSYTLILAYVILSKHGRILFPIPF